MILTGLSTAPDKVSFAARNTLLAISFRLPAAEILLHRSIAPLLNSATSLPDNFWEFTEDDTRSFDRFCNKATSILLQKIPAVFDNRKQLLFDSLYTEPLIPTIKELSARCFWSSRQINRYFQEWFGLSLKTYRGIQRFRNTFRPISEGKFFPEEYFYDQPHFIREVRKLSGVSPRELFRNENDRFIQFSALKAK
ncbi:putative AraC family transcriptional regulator [Flavihumibacter petaseus NBRC 106054]|uniref:Putative AraC family transcriptional regulator n=2 Tax=Flavihumibacter TaxID=1004301 RepID=A0A0E9MY58_9BACT|nr:putative AraC family transcriptional regulator [Flavihumibacter petaseus NBRC 106054]